MINILATTAASDNSTTMQEASLALAAYKHRPFCRLEQAIYFAEAELRFFAIKMPLPHLHRGSGLTPYYWRKTFAKANLFNNALKYNAL